MHASGSGPFPPNPVKKKTGTLDGPCNFLSKKTYKNPQTIIVIICFCQSKSLKRIGDVIFLSYKYIVGSGLEFKAGVFDNLRRRIR